jgi:hypothetical protein
MGESLASASQAGPQPPSEPPAGRARRSARLRTAAGATALALAAGGAVFLGMQVLQPGAADDLVPLASVDFGSEPDGLVAEGEGWSAEVAASAMQLRATHPGAMHPLWITSPATDEMAVTATLSWPDDAAVVDSLYVGGVTVLGASGAGWGVACGTDGNAYVLAVWDGRSQALDTITDSGCGGEPFTLGIDARPGGSGTDTIEARLPDGERVVLKPGEVRGPFTGAGFVMAAGDSTLTVPGLDVRTYEVLVSEESLGAGSS